MKNLFYILILSVIGITSFNIYSVWGCQTMTLHGKRIRSFQSEEEAKANCSGLIVTPEEVLARRW